MQRCILTTRGLRLVRTSRTLWVRGVWTAPGRAEVQRMLPLDSSMASCRVLTIDPPPDPCRDAAAVEHPSRVPIRFTSIIARGPSSSRVAARVGVSMPALLTQTVNGVRAAAPSRARLCLATADIADHPTHRPASVASTRDRAAASRSSPHHGTAASPEPSDTVRRPGDDGRGVQL